jgi:transposase-like protein
MARKHKRAFGGSWGMDEIYIKVKGVAIKRMTRPMFNFKLFRGGASVLAGVELMHMIREGQFPIDGADAMSFTDRFYALAGQVRPV